MTSGQTHTTRFSRFVMVGIVNNLFLFGLFLLLVFLDVLPILASGLVYCLGVCISYFANRRWSFRSESNHRADLPRFLFSYVVGLVVTLVSMSLLLQWLAPAFAQAITIGITAIATYLTMYFSGFGNARAKAASINRRS